jgi:glyoxylase-like metal-dependent hydrolase (beta-lactamase superfamily II)
LKAAAANNATAQPQTIAGKKYTVVTFMGQNKAKVNGYINDQKLVERVETWVDNAVSGDTRLEVAYSGYKDFGGVQFPTRIVEKQGGYPVLDFPVSDVKTNIAANISAPQGRGGAANPGGPPPPAQPPAATSQKLGEGVYLILPGYAALAVEFKDHIVVIEGPSNDTRANAIIAEAKKVIPNKPIKYVVNTHIHFDHSGGLRAFVAEGATIITHQVNKGYWEKWLATPHTLNPDKQETARKKISVETIGDKKILSDGTRVVELHRLQGNLHQEGIIVAYLPKEKILVQADVFNPPAQPATTPPSPVNPGTVNLVENLERLKLDVETIVPVHYPADGRRVTKAELMTAAGKGSSN